MLSYDTLIEQAKIRGMPPTKGRGILREYLQILILRELSKYENGRKLFFTGGTYLRLVHGLKRFSEDLDFNTEKMKKTEFEALVRSVAKEMGRLNIKSRARFKHWGNISSADLIFPAVEEQYGIVSKYTKKAGIVIKIETNRPSWKIRKETGVISGFGEIFASLCTDRGAFFADKIDALIKKKKGRHLYDIIFMISNQFPIDMEACSVLNLGKEPLKMLLDYVMNLSKSELKKQAESLRPFLFEEGDADLVIDAHQVIPALLKKYKPE